MYKTLCVCVCVCVCDVLLDKTSLYKLNIDYLGTSFKCLDLLEGRANNQAVKRNKTKAGPNF